MLTWLSNVLSPWDLWNIFEYKLMTSHCSRKIPIFVCFSNCFVMVCHMKMWALIQYFAALCAEFRLLHKLYAFFFCFIVIITWLWYLHITVKGQSPVLFLASLLTCCCSWGNDSPFPWTLDKKVRLARQPASLGFTCLHLPLTVFCMCCWSDFLHWFWG